MKFEQIDWFKYFNELLNIPVTESEEVIVNVPTFIAKIDKLLPLAKKRYHN